MATIKAGTYRFNDVLMNVPLTGLGVEGEFSVSVSISSGQVVVFGCDVLACMKYAVSTDSEGNEYYNDKVFYRVTTSSIDPSTLGLVLPYEAVVYFDGWNTDAFGSGLETITITEDTEVSDEFSTWFTANAVSLDAEEETPLATISYNGSTIASLNGGQTATLKCKGMTMADNVLVEVAEQTGGGGSDANIVPLIVGENGTYDANAPIIVTEEFTGGGTPDAYYFGQYPMFKAKTLIAPSLKEIIGGIGTGQFGFSINGESTELSTDIVFVNTEKTYVSIVSDGAPIVVWLFANDDYEYAANNGFEPNAVYVIDAWTLGMMEEGQTATLTALGTAETAQTPINGFMPVTVALPLKDELVINIGDFLGNSFVKTEYGITEYYRSVKINKAQTEWLTVTPDTVKQTFTPNDNSYYAQVVVEAADITKMKVLCDISLDPLPKTEYKVGDLLDTSGSVMVRHFTNGETVGVSLRNLDVCGWKKVNGVGKYTLYAEYTENGITCRCPYDITVTE